MTGAGSGLRILLILSAIDLLSSALTAGVVLFVILVGADAGQSGDDSQKGKVGFNFVEVADRSGKLSVEKRVSLPPTKSRPTGVEALFFESAADIVHRQYVIPADVKKLQISSSDRAFSFEFFVQPVVGLSFRLFIECADQPSPLEIGLRPTLTFPVCEKGSTTKTQRVSLPAGTKLILPATTRLDGLPAPEFESTGYARYTLPNAFSLSGTGMWGVAE